MSAQKCKIELFGSLRITAGAETFTHFRTQKTGLLLAYLACFAQRSHRREELIDLLWPEYEIDSGRNCLRIALNALRQQAEYGSSDQPPVIMADRQYVQLNPQAVVIDKSEFEIFLAAAQREPSEAERATLLKQAVALYRSDLLLDYEAPWLTGERQRLAEANLLALRRLIRLLVKGRTLDEALHYAQCAVAADPLREESHRVLMQIYGAQGSPGAALRQYQEMARVLEEQLNAKPSSAARSLLAQITNGPPAKSTDGDVATVVNSAPTLTPAPPSPAPIAPFTPGVLPVPRTRFFGREDCLAQVVEMLDTPETRLITLTGFGGSGKTRLALAVAERLHSDLSGAVWFVPLNAVTSAERIPEALLQALSVRSDGVTPPIEQAARALSGRPSLLVLDNFEHLADSGAVMVQELLDRAPQLSCLVTSRQRLNVAGEYEYAVLPLATPQSPGTAERLLEFASVQLFVDRARAARRDFQLTPTNAAAVASLCHHLEGVPLSIELAAAYVQAMTPAQIRDRLTPRLPLLVSRQRDAQPRHASLRATLDWSYQLLTPPVQRFLARLSVFRGGWTLEAAEAVCSEPLAIEYLMQLRERSLVTVEETGEAMRYSLLETVREYAAEQLSPAELTMAGRLHVAHYLALADTAEPELVGPDSPLWLANLEREHANFRTALAFSLPAKGKPSGQEWREATATLTERTNTSSEVEPPAGLRLAAALWRFWYLHGHYDEGGEWLERALAECESVCSAAMTAWRGAGNLAYDTGQFERARTAFNRLLSLAHQMGSSEEEAAALGSLGNLALAQDDLDQAKLLLEASLKLFKRNANVRGSALVLANLALVAMDSGDAEGACVSHRESLDLFEKVHDTQNLALAHNNLGHAAMRAGDYEQASVHLRKGLALARSLSSPLMELYVIVNLSSLFAHQQRWRQAALLCGVTDNRIQEHSADLLPKAQAYYQWQRRAIQHALSDDEFNQLWQQGQNMRMDQVEDLVNEKHATVLI